MREPVFQLIRARTAASIAVTGERSLTYGQLESLSNRIAHHLIAAGVAPAMRVGVSLERRVEMVAALLGIMKAGAAYVPIDPHYPPERVAYLLKDGAVAHVLTESAHFDKFGAVERVLSVDDGAIAEHADTAPEVRVTEDDPAYVIYTSGSTGQPKGVVVPHGALSNHTVAMSSTYALTHNDHVLQVASISFDVAGEEIYPTLLSGARLVLRPDDLLQSFDRFMEFLNDQTITVANLSTAFWHAWVSHLDNANHKPPASLRALIVGTEQASTKHLNTWTRIAGPSVDWFNSYGPTETTITSTCYAHDGSIVAPDARLPIGHPIANTTVHVLDETRSPVAQGNPGELYIGGAGVALGYLGRPELTAQRFIQSPFDDNDRLYKTGDLVTQRHDGALEYVGRVDFQVKIRGYRIELGEIESVLAQHPDVTHVVVTAPEDNAGQKRLVAYVVPVDSANPPAVGALRDTLKRALPEYMVPAAILIMPELPLTPNGKVDRDALPAPDWSRIKQASYTAPTTPTEAFLCRLWSSTLGIEQIGIDDNFFDIGGHSLHAVTMFGGVHAEYGVDLPLARLLEHPTVAQLATLVDASVSSGQSSEFRTLVALRAQGERLPFICASGTGGNVLLFHDLVSYLPQDQPFYGLQFVGVDGRIDPFDTFEQMAAQHVRDIREAFPNGPYVIGGYSGGSQVAFEIAQQLVRQGAEVRKLIVIDMPIGLLSTESATDKVSRQKEALSQGGLSHFQEWVATRAWWEFERLSLGAIRRYARLTGGSIPLAYRDRYMNEAWSRARAQYVYKPYPGRIDVFRTAEYRDKGIDLGWDQVARDGVTMHELPGAHHSIMRPPHVSALAQSLATVLEEAHDGRSRKEPNVGSI